MIKTIMLAVAASLIAVPAFSAGTTPSSNVPAACCCKCCSCKDCSTCCKEGCSSCDDGCCKCGG